MVRKVVGRISREMNREMVNYSGPKTASGAKHRKSRRVSAPKHEGLGVVYRDDEDI